MRLVVSYLPLQAGLFLWNLAVLHYLRKHLQLAPGVKNSVGAEKRHSVSVVAKVTVLDYFLQSVEKSIAEVAGSVGIPEV